MARWTSRLSRSRSVVDLTRQLGREIAAYEREIAAPYGLTPGQAQALVELSDVGPLAMHDLADELRIARSTATRLVDQMVRRGWVRRSADPSDRRKILLELEASGRDLVERISGADVVRGLDLIQIGRLDDEDLEALTRVSHALAAARDRWRDQGGEPEVEGGASGRN